MQKKVLIAVGDETYTGILKKTFKNHPNSFLLSSQEVYHRRFLSEIVEFEQPDILIIHDYYLGSDLTREELKEKELLTFIRNMRVNYEDAVRVVFLCEREKGDPLLSSLVTLGVMDIFNANSFDLDQFIEQLKETPRFSRVEKFLLTSAPIDYDIEEKKEDKKEEVAKPVEKQERPVIQKVVEKKVIQKVINRNVIKRDYKIEITNNTEKIIGVPINKKLIMIGSPVSRSGSTFISHLLARSLTQMGISTTFIESPFSRAYTFDRFAGTESLTNYKSPFNKLSKHSEPSYNNNFHWSKDDVELICKHPMDEPIYKEEEITFEHLLKILYATKSTVTILDVGTDWHFELYQDVFDIADHAYCIVEPDIPFIQYFEESSDEAVQFIHNQLKQGKASLIGNRFDPSLMKDNLITDQYGEHLKAFIPSFPSTDVFQAQCKGIFLNDYKDYQKKLEPIIQPLIEDLLPQEFIKKQNKGLGLLKGLFNKQIKIEKKESKGEKTI